MSKYIDAEKLIERLEEMKRAEYENCGGVNSKTGALQEVQELIASLQQEQPEADFEKEIVKYLMPIEAWQIQEAPFSSMANIARHFYELGLNARKNE